MEFLLEIMTEELPSAHVQGALAQLLEGFSREIRLPELRPPPGGRWAPAVVWCW